MSFILASGWPITMNERRGVLEPASVRVQNDRIAAIGSLHNQTVPVQLEMEKGVLPVR